MDEIENFNKKIKKILITQQEINCAVEDAAKWINGIYDKNPIVLISVLNGSFIFAADLFRRITVPCQIDFIKAQSYYNSTVSSGNISITQDIHTDVSKFNVVIVEDIVDTGRTLKEITKIIRERNPISLNVITLLDKPSRRETDFAPDKSLFTIPDVFVVGYGMDCGEYYRNLPYIAEYDQQL